MEEEEGTTGEAGWALLAVNQKTPVHPVLLLGPLLSWCIDMLLLPVH